MSLFGWAGPVAAGLAAGACLLLVDTRPTTAAAFFGLRLRRRSATARSGAGALLTALLLRPWWAFWPAPSDDGELQDFHAEFRLLAWRWVLGAVGATATCLDDGTRRLRRPNPPPPDKPAR